jgi:hypothetical protein
VIIDAVQFGMIDVTELRPSCGCMAPRLEQRHLGPGEEAALRVEVNTLSQAAGPHTWQVRVAYQGEGQPGELTVALAGRIVSEVAVEPPALILTTETVLAHEVVVADRRERPLEVLGAHTTLPGMKVALGDPHRDADGRWARAVRLEVLADCPEGRHEGVLHIATDDKTYPQFDVPVTVVKHAAGRVRASPEAVEVSGPASQPLPAQIVLLSSSDGREVRVERVEADDPAVECRWAAGPGARATLKVRVDAAKVAGGALRTAVHVHLAGPTPLTVEIPVVCTLR